MGYVDVITGDSSSSSSSSQSQNGPDATSDDLVFDLEFLNEKTLYEEIVKCGMFLSREEEEEAGRDCCQLVEAQSDGADRGGGGPWSDLEEVRHWKSRIEATCRRLSIHADPHIWSAEEVLLWCQDTLRDLGLPSDPSIVAGLAVDGTTFCMLDEEEFRSRSAQAGEALYAELVAWKSFSRLPSLSESFDLGRYVSSDSVPVYLDLNATDSLRYDPASSSSSSRDEVMTSSDDEPPSLLLLRDLYSLEYTADDVIGCSTPRELLLGTNNPFFSETSLKREHQDRSFVSKNVACHHQTSPNDSTTTTSTITTTTATTAAPSSRSTLTDVKNWPISRERHSTHLWQFLKELLSVPTAYGDCIRWTDHQNGVFRIEDSTRVAKLWGERKHRPAMNYDKLSRSIRQYYKKGIIRKTQQSKRLVYQFYPQYI